MLNIIFFFHKLESEAVLFKLLFKIRNIIHIYKTWCNVYVEFNKNKRIK